MILHPPPVPRPLVLPLLLHAFSFVHQEILTSQVSPKTTYIVKCEMITSFCSESEHVAGGAQWGIGFAKGRRAAGADASGDEEEKGDDQQPKDENGRGEHDV
jgi:hypothetical protein